MNENAQGVDQNDENVKIFVVISNLSDFIEVDTNIKSGRTQFLLDSQADVSIIKSCAIAKYSETNLAEIIRIKGITDEVIHSLGTIYITIDFDDNSQLEHKFPVVPDSFPIPADGIIGKDFLHLNFCRIDYYTLTFSVRFDTYETHVPIKLKPTPENMILPSRCAAFRIFKIKNYKGPCVIDGCEIERGIFMATTIATEPEVVIRVLNTQEEMCTISSELLNARAI